MSELTILRRGSVPAPKRKTVTIEVPELGCAVMLKELSYGQLKDISDDVPAQLALMIVDDNGEQVFQSPEEIASISEFSGATVTKLIQAAATLNGLAKEVIAETEKNS